MSDILKKAEQESALRAMAGLDAMHLGGDDPPEGCPLPHYLPGILARRWPMWYGNDADQLAWLIARDEERVAAAKAEAEAAAAEGSTDGTIDNTEGEGEAP